MIAEILGDNGDIFNRPHKKSLVVEKWMVVCKRNNFIMMSQAISEPHTEELNC